MAPIIFTVTSYGRLRGREVIWLQLIKGLTPCDTKIKFLRAGVVKKRGKRLYVWLH